MANGDERAEVVEHGNVYFLFRPKVGQHEPGGVDDVQRLYMALEPAGKSPIRLVVIGRKRLPDLGDHERGWAFVETLARSGAELERGLREEHYETKTRGEQELPAARPAGEGVYALVRRGRQLYLAYELELPREPGPVQKALRIAPAASFVVSIKNPQKGSARSAGLGPGRSAEYPAELMAVFRDRRFATEEPRLLDYEGAELVLVGARGEPEEELDVELGARRESARSADIFKRLRMDRKRHPDIPLLEGQWA